MLVFLQLNTKSFVHGSDRAGENDCTAGGTFFFDCEFVLTGKCFDLGNAFWVGPVAFFKFLTAHDVAFCNWFSECVSAYDRFLSRARTQANGHVHHFFGIGWTYFSRPWQRSALTTCKQFFVRSR